MTQTKLINISTHDGVCDTFIAHPDTGAHPAVILFMDAFGPREYLYQMAQKLASHGYYVLLPNMFYRVKSPPVIDIPFPLKPADMPAAVDQIMALLKTLTPEMAMRDVDALIDFLAAQENVLQGKIGTTGYCMGGALSLRTAARHPEKVAAAASFHAGNLASESPDSPHLLLNKIAAEIYIASADHDKSMPPEQIDRLNTALTTIHAKHQSELYNDAIHGFTMADLPAYNAAALERHWENLLPLLARNLAQ